MSINKVTLNEIIVSFLIYCVNNKFQEKELTNYPKKIPKKKQKASCC